MGACLEEFVFERRMKPLATTFAAAFGVEVDQDFVCRATTQNVLPELGGGALAFMAAKLRDWVARGDTISIICDGATIKDKHYQAVGHAPPLPP